MSINCICLKPFLVLCAILGPLAPAVAATSDFIPLKIDAHQEQSKDVYIWKRDKCAEDQVPDSPARAFRRADGSVVLFATHDKNQPFIGKDLESVSRTCASTYRAAMDNNPNQFDAKIWLQTFYTEDGNKVYSLGSSDYHGTWFKQCSNGTPNNPKCWSSAITLAVSNDGGRTFSNAPPPNHVIARAPTQDAAKPGQPDGFFTTSNIVRRDNYLYALFFTQGFKGQPRGNCLARTSDIASPSSWEVMKDGRFDAKFVDPNKPDHFDEAKNTCDTIKSLPGMIRSLTFHEPTNQYIAVFADSHRNKGRDGETLDVTFRYSISKDLLAWSKPTDIMSIPGPTQCKKGIPFGSYPSIISEDSKDRNFSTVTDKAFLYYSRFNSTEKCKSDYDRDLVRVPLTIEVLKP